MLTASESSVEGFGAVQKIENALKSFTYREAIENSSVYNNRLVVDRKTRLPFIDSQTGVAQSDCFLWMQKWDRMPGSCRGQIYTYPSKRWLKRRRGYLHTDYSKKTVDLHETETNGTEDRPLKAEAEAIAAAESVNEKWYAELDDDDIPDAGELDDPETEDDDYEEYSSRRRRSRKPPPSAKKRKEPENDKPFPCDMCKSRYKTKTGLSYHYQNVHHIEFPDGKSNGDSRSGFEEEVYKPAKSSKSSNSSKSTSNSSKSGSKSTSAANDSNKPAVATALPSSAKEADSSPPSKIEQEEVSKDGKKSVTASPYCDFCLGDSDENKKTKSAEILISCSDCGRSGHPTCLQFTENMCKSVKKYRWQCIECKSCGICGTSDNDEQLLFCDDCDRGYHMYCLTPPISEPPEGSWSCHLCIIEYHTPKLKPESIPASSAAAATSVTTAASDVAPTSTVSNATNKDQKDVKTDAVKDLKESKDQKDSKVDPKGAD